MEKEDNESSPNLVQEEPIANDVPVANEFVDKMTLELLMNKNHYHRYTAQTNPKRFAEIEAYRENLRAYREPILEMTKDLLSNPQKQINTDVNETFEHYTKSLIRYFKIKELENRSYFGRDDDVLFDKIDEKPFIQNATQEAFYKDPMRTFWSKEQVIKR